MMNNYNELLNKYNRLIAQYNDLECRKEDKEEAWEIIAKRNDTISDLSRKLCEDILAKDPSEMRLGKEYAWGNIDIIELLHKSIISFEKYTQKRTEIMRQINEESERRRLEIENLQSQVDIAHRDMVSIINQQTGEVNPIIPEDTSTNADQQTGEVNSIIPENAPASVKGAAEGGKIKVVEESSDVTKEDFAEIMECQRIGETVNCEIDDSIQVSREHKKQVAKKAYKNMGENEKKMNRDVTMQGITDKAFVIIKAIGMTGYYKTVDISKKAFELYEEQNMKVSQSSFKSFLPTLSNMGIIKIDEVGTPFSKMMTYELTNFGKEIYKERFKKDAVISKAQILISKHDNLDHALGIEFSMIWLEKSEFYQKINMDGERIQLKDCVYVPDILATTKHGKKEYYEYERGNHTQQDWNYKLEKMYEATNEINIIASDNTTMLEKIIPKTLKWIKDRSPLLKNKTIKVTTIHRIKTAIEKNNGNRRNLDDIWLYKFDNKDRVFKPVKIE